MSLQRIEQFLQRISQPDTTDDKKEEPTLSKLAAGYRTIADNLEHIDREMLRKLLLKTAEYFEERWSEEDPDLINALNKMGVKNPHIVAKHVLKDPQAVEEIKKAAQEWDWGKPSQPSITLLR